MIIKSDAYDEYWKFAFLRQLAFRTSLPQNISHIEQQHEDPIIKKYKFTNCYRALDRTSQFLIKEVIHSNNWSPENTFFRVLLFKVFNKIETWQILEKEFGAITLETFSPMLFCSALDHAKKNKEKIYSAAYIMPSGIKEFGSTKKHENNIMLIELLIKKELHKRIWDIKNLEDVYKALLATPTLGPFLAFQYSIDLGYSPHSITKEDQFVVAGPGAIRGIEKCFHDIGKNNYRYIIEFMAESQEKEFNTLGLEFPYLKNRKLQLIDIQNLFCEVDKYLRVKRPDLSKYKSRIKQHYTKKTNPIEFTFPPKWNAAL
ncbi:nucleotide kinase domain-containing protein [Pseudomonas koreensis]|uniref:nucleotide kinase domain-containing protein n=1 Tax=Pseudomonas koreensis TaxID=198620 RepID=UPI003D985339